MIVRNNGGKDHIDKCKNYIFSATVNSKPYKAKLNVILKSIMQNEYKNEWDCLEEDQKNMFDINIYDTYSKKNLSKIDRNYGKLRSLFMLVGLYNKTFLEKLTNTLIPEQSMDRFKRSSLFRYLFFFT
jgi:hypothetical protein